MTNLAKAKWKVRCLHFPIMILISPLLVLIFGIRELLDVWAFHADEEARWAKYVDDYEAKKASGEAEV